jgi:hypothetical protein
MIEMDVGEQQGSRPQVAETLQQAWQCGLRTGVDQHVVDLPASDHALAAEMTDVDQPQRPSTKFTGHSPCTRGLAALLGAIIP